MTTRTPKASLAVVAPTPPLIGSVPFVATVSRRGGRLKLSVFRLDLLARTPIIGHMNTSRRSFLSLALSATPLAVIGAVPREPQYSHGLLRLARLSDIAPSVVRETLTAPLLAFRREGLSEEKIVSKMLAVWAKSAVGAYDLLASCSRASFVSDEAKVTFDQLIAMTATLQEYTARGGDHIGSALRSIFVRLPLCTETLSKVGVSTHTVGGDMLPALSIIEGYADVRDDLSEPERLSIHKKMGGGYYRSVLLSLLACMGSCAHFEQSRFLRLLIVSSNA